MDNLLRQRELPMQEHPLVLEAAYDTIHAGAISTTVLAQEMNKKPATLSNEVNPKQTGHKFGLIDSIYVQQRQHDFSILLQYSAALGHTAIPVGDFSGISDVELLECYSNWHAELGDVNKAVNRAFADRKLSAAEFALIEKEFIEAVAAGQVFLSRCRALIDEQ